MLARMKKLWALIRRLSGDDAYEHYLKHYAEFQTGTLNAPPPLSRKEFFKLWQDGKWKSIKRCC